LNGSDAMTVTITPKDVWPPSPVTDLVALPGAEGQMLLKWTAPDSNNYTFFPSVSPATSYSIRIATFSVATAGSTTTWWNNAVDVQSLPYPGAGSALPATPPVPLAPGTTQTLLLNRLDPGATYYAMMISADSVGNISDSDVPSRTGAQAHALVFDAAPPTPSSFTVVAVGTSSFNVSWRASSAFDLWYYKLYVDSVTENFSNAYTLAISSNQLSTTLINLTTGTYTFRLAAVDKGTPTYVGTPLESAFTPVIISTLAIIPHAPQTPYGVSLSSSGAATTISWLPVVRYADFTPFSASSAPTPAELQGYHVFRATSPVLGSWSDLAFVSTATLSYVDLTSGPQYYYHVRSQNYSALSGRSEVLAAATKDVFLVAPDDQSNLHVPAALTGPLTGASGSPTGTYLVDVSSRPADLGTENGRVFQSISFTPYEAGVNLSKTFDLGGMSWLTLHYDVGPGGAPASAVQEKNTSIYWFDGSKWVQLYGRLDALAQTVSIQTQYVGGYQLRSVERSGGFYFNPASISNRFVTPNGDGKNDNVVIRYDNPQNSKVSVRIFDLRGHLLAAELPPGPVANSVQWNGTAGGRPVPGGVYIYKIQCEGQTFSGTLVLIK
jgi:gliding motility-associated-like protein